MWQYSVQCKGRGFVLRQLTIQEGWPYKQLTLHQVITQYSWFWLGVFGKGGPVVSSRDPWAQDQAGEAIQDKDGHLWRVQWLRFPPDVSVRIISVHWLYRNLWWKSKVWFLKLISVSIRRTSFCSSRIHATILPLTWQRTRGVVHWDRQRDWGCSSTMWDQETSRWAIVLLVDCTLHSA